MAQPKNTSRKEDLLDKSEDGKTSRGTSGSREESMDESDSSAHDPSSSGTTSLGGESSDSQSRLTPGGVEGEGGNS